MDNRIELDDRGVYAVIDERSWRCTDAEAAGSHKQMA
jgi:hypothetical protein